MMVPSSVVLGCLLSTFASAQISVPSFSLASTEVSMYPVTTQTSFNSPSCTGSAKSATQQFTVNYNFESATGDDVSATTPIGVYNLLNFTNVNFVNTDPDLDGNHLGLAPHTYPNAAVFASNTSSGVISPFVTGIPLITAGYIESTLTSFTPHSFWYGCVADFPYSAGSLPVSCNITAVGFNKAGTKLASQLFQFVKNTSQIMDQNEGHFKSAFAGSYSVGFQVTHSGSVPASALIDNFIATLSQKACSPYYTGSYNNGT